MARNLVREAPEAVVRLLLQMQETMVELRAEISRLQAEVAELKEQNRPPSAPHRRREDERTTQPKKPGRKAGHQGHCRPVPEQVDEVLEVPLPGCPHCQGAVEGLIPVVQWIEELPEVRPRVTKLTTYEAHCPCCQCLVRSTHPLQTSTAGGCAGVQLGARALAVAAELKHGLGLTLSKTQRALQTLGGLRVSRGGLALAFQRMAHRLEPVQQILEDQLLASPVVHSDETSWWVGGPQSLWVFTTPGPEPLTLYYVVEHRDRATFHGVIPPTWQGLLITDCLSVYDGATDRQHKCFAHHLKALRTARLAQSPQVAAADAWVERVKTFFTDAAKLKARWPELAAEQRAAERQTLAHTAFQLFDQPRADPAQESFRARIGKQFDHLLAFLDEPLADSTNNLAERQLRPAVIARKLSCGNKTTRGAAAWQALTSLAATCAQRAQSFVGFIAPRLTLFPKG